MFVYFIRCGDTDLIKIGKARNVETRLDALQTGCPYKLNIFIKIKCKSEEQAFQTEMKLHKILSCHRFRGEWFKLPNSEIKKIGDVVDKNVEIYAFNMLYISEKEKRIHKKK